MALPLRPRAIDELQAASAVGQGKLYQVYDELLRARGVPTAQVLLTFFDISARTHYLNARQTLRKLLEWRVVPVINENDTTTTDEISFGNNDFLAAQVAILLGAEQLLLLTDADGVFTADPADRSRALSSSPRSRSSTTLDGARHRTRHLAAGIRRDAIEGGGGRDGHRGRDPHRDRQRPRAGSDPGGSRRRADRHPLSRPGRALLELQAVAQVRQAGARHECWSTPARRVRCARAGPACCRSASSTSRASSTPATPSRSSTRRATRRQGDLQLLGGRAAPGPGPEVRRGPRGAAPRQRRGRPPRLLRPLLVSPSIPAGDYRH